MNAMVQGGASGSPIFSRETGEVLGAVYAGVFDYEMEDGDDGKKCSVSRQITHSEFQATS
jgi:V8-like Glu-specific endopeptidase